MTAPKPSTIPLCTDCEKDYPPAQCHQPSASHDRLVEEIEELEGRLSSTVSARDLTIRDLHQQLDAERAARAELEAKLNTPELHDFAKAVVLEAAHQRERWPAEHDAGKEPADWFWLLGYLAGKALRAHSSADIEKALHHCISSAAALANWHTAITGEHTRMRPGIDPVARGVGVPDEVPR